jgi:hypothetical protein
VSRSPFTETEPSLVVSFQESILGLIYTCLTLLSSDARTYSRDLLKESLSSFKSGGSSESKDMSAASPQEQEPIDGRCS